MSERLHRNNAAERAMVIALTPVAWVVRRWVTMRGRQNKTEPAGPAARPSAGSAQESQP